MKKETANKVLLAVCSIAKPGEYIILNRSELAKNLPSDYHQEDVDEAMLQLQASDYVTVRYSDGDVYCLSVLTKGYVYGEKLKEQIAAKQEEEQARQHSTEKADALGALPELSDDDDELVPDVSSLSQRVRSVTNYPWKKFFLICAGASFLGGAIAGVITAIIMKIILK